MGVKYKCNFYGTHGTNWEVQLWDSSYSSSTTVIKLMDPGFTLEYQGQGKEIFDPIKGSQLKVHLCIEDNATGSALLTWIQGTLLTNQEDRFNIALYKNRSIYWFGVVLPDLSGFADASKPFEFVLTASDGLARLKDFTFDYAVSTDNMAKFSQIIYNLLKKTPAYISGTQTYLFSTNVDWYEDQMEPKGSGIDPINTTYVHTKSFAKKADDGTWEGMTYYDVLEQICKHWGMRVMMVDGLFKFVQLGCYEDGLTEYERFYLKSTGVYDTASSFSPKVQINVSAGSLPRVKSGNQWNYYPALKDVYLRMPFINKNFLNGAGNVPYTETTTNPLIGGININLAFSTTLVLSFPSLPTGGLNVEVKIKLKLDSTGIKYLKKDPLGAVITWENTVNVFDAVIFVNSSITEIPVTFITPDIPSGAYDGFELTIDSIVVTGYLTGTTYTNGVDYQYFRKADSTSLKFVSSGLDADYYTYVAHNTASVINSYDITEPDALYGDGYFAGSYGSLYVWKGADMVISSGNWTQGHAGTAYFYNILRVRDIMGAQARPTPKYQGAIVGGSSITAYNSVVYSGRIYVMNGASLTGIPEEWDGEWVEVDYQHASVESDIPVLAGGDTNANTLQRSQQRDSQGLGDQVVINQRLNQSLQKLSNDVPVMIGQAVGGIQNQINQRIGFLYTQTVSGDTDLYPVSQLVFTTDSVNLNMPSASAMFSEGKTCEIAVINADGNSTTIYPYGSELINGADHLTLAGGRSVTLVSNGSNIYILNSYKLS